MVPTVVAIQVGKIYKPTRLILLVRLRHD